MCGVWVCRRANTVIFADDIDQITAGEGKVGHIGKGKGKIRG